jgi:hypothetical protein
MSSKIVVGILCTIALCCMVIPLAPHFVRTVSAEHGIVLAMPSEGKHKRKLHPVSPSELRQLVARTRKDTILVHFWNTWRNDGTRYVRKLNRLSHRNHPSTAVVHICTDMTGLQQQKASRMIAEKLGIPGPLLCIRSRANIFDLRNSDATGKFYKSLTGKNPEDVSPSVLALDKHGLPMAFDGKSFGDN